MLYLNYHKQKYPKMNEQDIYKLLYQSFFGIAHAIKDVDIVNKYLNEEINISNNEADLYDVISSNFVRINLSTYKKYNLNINDLSKMFITSQVDGDINLFKKTIEKLNLPKFNYQPVHHSSIYNIEYNPHYRVILKKYIDLNLKYIQLLNFIKNQTKPLIISIEGKCGSGKTTLANKFSDIATIISVDDFFLPPKLKTKSRLDQVGGNINYEKIKEMLINIKTNKQISYDKYDCSLDKYEKVFLPYNDIIILEGVYSYHPYFNNLIDKLVYIDIDDKTQKERINKRANADKFFSTWIPLENKYYEKSHILDNIDLII